MLPAEHAFSFGTDLSLPPVDGSAIFAHAVNNRAQVGVGDEFFAIGGHIVFDAGHGGLLADILPPLLHINGGSPEASAIRWVLGQLAEEVASDRPGARLASDQLSQFLLVRIIRSYLAASGSLPPGWIRAMTDERIGPVLRLIHRAPSRAWRLAELAREAGMSRTNFAVRFKAVAGVAPLTYLLDWRIRLAERALREGSMSVAELAHSIGYNSESAFSNAFKRTTGMAPRRYRTRFAGNDRAPD